MAFDEVGKRDLRRDWLIMVWLRSRFGSSIEHRLGRGRFWSGSEGEAERLVIT